MLRATWKTSFNSYCTALCIKDIYEKKGTCVLYICLIFTLNLGNFARKLEVQSSRLHACMLNIYSIISMTNNIPSHLVWSELFGAELKRERGGGRDLYLNVKLFLENFNTQIIATNFC